jgi:hypothetical protein
MKAVFLDKENRLLIERFPLFLFSRNSFFKLLNILKDDFFISLSGVKESKKEDGCLAPDSVDICLVGKEELDKEGASDIFKEMMSVLISFESGALGNEDIVDND